MIGKAAPYILGFSDSVHDRSVCLFRGAEPVVAIEEERLSRVKHGLTIFEESRRDPSLFAKMKLESRSAQQNECALDAAVRYCLDAAGIGWNDLSVVVGNSLHTAFPFRGRALYVNHHLAHAASAYFASGYDDAAILVADGYGDPIAEATYETVLVGHGRGNDIRIERSVSGRVSSYYDMENSLGVFYRIGTLLAGFGLFDEGKTMGLAAYGRPVHRALVEEHVRFEDDVVRIDNGGLWHHLLEALPDRADFEARADIAATFQKLLDEAMLHYARRLRGSTRAKNLCIAGGVGLNCVTNTVILEDSGFEDVFVFPAPGDNGVSFGAAYLAANQTLRLPRVPRLQRADHGRCYSPAEIRAALEMRAGDVQFDELDDERLLTRAARLLAEDQIVMWFQGGAEVGPRALGFRSIFANPRTAATKDYVNAEVKHREAFRPLAPLVLEEQSTRYFDLSGPSPFMLFSPRVHSITREVACGIVHADGTARLQTLNSGQNPRVHRLVRKVGALTGTPMILNTSFNRKDEPIVETPADALAAYLASPLEYLVMDAFFVTRSPRT